MTMGDGVPPSGVGLCKHSAQGDWSYVSQFTSDFTLPLLQRKMGVTKLRTQCTAGHGYTALLQRQWQ